ncbi:MAG: thrombospondin type 3 repeat-containing protein [Dehalococcoidia bacterium]|nr:thrombospondin type 3 repeat-containing protein [Dehalococcoidia bacterium]
MELRSLQGVATLALLLLAALLPASPPASARSDVIALPADGELPVASVVLRDADGGAPASVQATCDKDIDTTSQISGVAFVAAQDNGICTTGDLVVYSQGGQTYVAQAGGQEAAFTITGIAADGTPSMVTQKYWTTTNTYTADIQTFVKGGRRYVALALERLSAVNASCGVAIIDVTDAPNTGTPLLQSGGDWCDVHNIFVENDAGGDGRYVYLTADGPNDMRVLDIADLGSIQEIGRYTHPQASNANYVHDMVVVDHGGSSGRRVYVSYWDAGLMVLDADDVTPGVIEPGSANQPLNPDHSIDPAGFLTHHAVPAADGSRVFIEDEFIAYSGGEPVQMWDISNFASPQYVDGIAMGTPLMPVLEPAHNLYVVGSRLYVGWYKAGLQAFDFTPGGFTSRALYHQAQTEAADDPYDGAWAIDSATIGGTAYLFQSDRRYGLIVDAIAGDADGDGVPDAADNCPSWPNAGQQLPPWPVPAGDPDCDGFADSRETYMGTDSSRHCAATAPADDEPVDAWPPDLNDDQQATLGDVLRYILVFNTSAPGPPYTARFDLNADGVISLADVLLFIPFFNNTCTP